MTVENKCLDFYAYLLKCHCPWIYHTGEELVGIWTGIRYRNVIDQAITRGTITGTVDGKTATIRPLGSEDVPTIHAFLKNIPETHLKYFHPHSFTCKKLKNILKKSSLLTYGLFVEKKLVAYALLKLYPGEKAFRGRLVAPEWTRKGIGTWLSTFLDWQCHLLGFKARSTVCTKNTAALKSQTRNRGYQIIGHLQNDYKLIEYNQMKAVSRPQLLISPKEIIYNIST